MTKREIIAKIDHLKALGILTERFFNAGGKGGQHQNRTSNAVELVGRCNVKVGDGTPFEIEVRATSATERSQLSNRVKACGVLMSRLKARIDELQKDDRIGTAGFGGGRHIRTYNAARGVVKDHISGEERPYREVMAGSRAFGELIDARRVKIRQGLDKEKGAN